MCYIMTLHHPLHLTLDADGAYLFFSCPQIPSHNVAELIAVIDETPGFSAGNGNPAQDGAVHCDRQGA